ncbi:MAG: hypothetical protein AAGA48_35940 [Myxococcota bacterium]
MGMIEPNPNLEDLHVAVGFLPGWSELLVRLLRPAPSSALFRIHTVVDGHYRALRAEDLTTPAIAALPPGTVPRTTIVCELPHHGRGRLHRRRNRDNPRITHLYFMGVDLVQFSTAIDAEVLRLQSTAGGVGHLQQWWRDYLAGGGPTEPPPPGADPRPPEPSDETDILRISQWIRWTTAWGEASLFLRKGFPLTAFDLAVPNLRITAQRADQSFVCPISILQDALSLNGDIAYTELLDSIGPHFRDIDSIDDISLFPTTTDGFAQHIIPVVEPPTDPPTYPYLERTCRPTHTGRRKTFAAENGPESYVFALEYTNPTPAALPPRFLGSDAQFENRRRGEPRGTIVTPGLDCTDAARRGGNPNSVPDYTPQRQNTMIVGCAEYATRGIAQFENWSAAQVHHYSKRIDRYDYTTIRTVRNTGSVVIHDTTSNASSTNISAHFRAARGGTVSQMADLLERVSHADAHSDTSIGIEVQNDWNFSTAGRDTVQDVAEYNDPTKRLTIPWLPWPPQHRAGAVRIPPEDCLEQLWRLVERLTSPGMPITVPQLFPQLDPRYWPDRELERLPADFAERNNVSRPAIEGIPRIRYVDHWTALGTAPSGGTARLRGADGSATTGDQDRGVRYWQAHVILEGGEIIHPGWPGVYGHNVISQDKGDGVYTTLYLWIRSLKNGARPAFNHTQARDHAKAILEQPLAATGRFGPVRIDDAIFVPIPDAVAAHVPPNRWSGASP